MTERIKLGIVGGGVLGHAMARGMNEHASVRLYDIVPEKSTHTLAEVAECEFIFVCVPTPCRADGRCETSIVEKAVRNLADEILKRDTMEQQAIVIRSTVPVGTTKRLAAQLAEYPELEDVALLHSPEFLTERCSLVDFQTPSRMLVGIPNLASHRQSQENGGYSVDESRGTEMGLKLGEIYRRRFPGVPIMVLDSDETEMAKLACNSFFGLKVAFFNAIHQWAGARGVAPKAVRDAILSDGRIAHAHTVANQGGIPGAGGSCIPKDLANAFYGLQEADLFKAAGILSAAWEWNKEIRQASDPKLPRFDLRNNRAARTGIPDDAVCYFPDGDQICCVRPDFTNLQESHVGFGETMQQAYDALLADEAKG